MGILILCAIYLVKLLCYQLGIRILFGLHVKKKVWIVACIITPVLMGVLIPLMAIILPINEAARNFLVSIGAVLVLFVSIEGKSVEKGVGPLLTLLLVECVDGIFTYPCQTLVQYIGSDYGKRLAYLASEICTLTCMYILIIVKMNMNSYKKTHIKSMIYLIIGIIAASMMLCLGIFNKIISFLSVDAYTVLYNVIYIAITISIFLLIIFVIYIKNTHERMEQLLKTEQLLKESQVNYYRVVLKKEDNTRKYRHDMMNHLIFIQDILNKKKLDDAQKYLSSILGGFQKIQNTYYVVGNEMIDTIMNYFFGMLPKDTKIEIRGRCPVEIDMEDTEICVIFSNVFQNAVEEIIENKLKNANVIVTSKKGRQFVEYNVRNTLYREIDRKRMDRNGFPKTHKLDKNNHGIGLINVKNTVDKSNGKFEWFQESGYFCVNIILPIKS